MHTLLLGCCFCSYSSSSTTCCVAVTLLLSHDARFIITLQWWLTLFPLLLQLESGDEVELEEFYVKFKGLWVSFFLRLFSSFNFHCRISLFQIVFSSLSTVIIHCHSMQDLYSQIFLLSTLNFRNCNFRNSLMVQWAFIWTESLQKFPFQLII